ncbi:MAG: hypothetical protein JXR22_00345 [Prolixibacteraceae bacterium]|nr:hypothetical protein [Prolixibacteraceae bacterium]
MEIQIREVVNKNDLRTFIYLPEKIHQNHPNWVHPIYLDEWDFFNPKKNKSFEHCDHVLLLAYKGQEAVGRCMGLIHHEYNQKHNELYGRFSFIETYDDQEVFHALVQHVASWAKSRGMEKLVGPLAFSDKDPQGFLVEGFDEPVVIASNCNFPYMVELIANEGFQKKVDLVVYKIDIPDQLPDIYQKIEERFKRNNTSLRVVEFTSRRKIKPLVRPVLQLINDTFNDIYGFTPFNEREMDDFANRYLYLVNPRFIKLVMNDENNVIGTIIGMSDLSKGIQKARGRLLPFGFIPILTAGRKSKQLNLMLGAVHPSYQGRGLEVLMGIKLIASARAEGKTVIDSHLELEYNTKVRAEMERMGGVVYKRYRLFEKSL